MDIRNTSRTFGRLRLVAAGALLLLALPGRLGAQPPVVSLSLQDSRIEVDRLAPGLTQGEAAFLVDQAPVLEVDAVATIDGLATSILAPTGEVIDETSIGALGGAFHRMEGAAGPGSPLLSPAGEPGFHSIYRFPSLGPGTYTVRFQAAASLSQEVAVITRLTTASPLVAGLVAPDSEIVVGNLAVLTAAVFEAGQPVPGASVAVQVRDPNGNSISVPLMDDGLGVDAAAGDGLYSGELTPAVPGSYGALARMTGTTSTGLPFVRQAATRFEVLRQTSFLTGDFTDSGSDDDGDGLFDRIVLQADTQTVEAGRYRLFVGLRTAGGEELVRSGEADLLPGLGSIAVGFEAEEFIALGENGPYFVSFLYLVRLDPAGVLEAHRLESLGQTQAYQLSQLQRPPLALTGAVTDQAFDDNGNGLYDRLVVDVEVSALRSGVYSWSFKLTDRSLHELGFGAGSAFLPAGTHTIRVAFDGQQIGLSGADGPYLLQDLLMFGVGASLVTSEIGQTSPYLARQFEGYIRDTEPPSLTVTVSPGVLWPANHRLEEILAMVTAEDNLDPDPEIRLLGVTSNEGENALGDGNTSDDIQGIEPGTDDRQFLLRAERSGLGTGRIYTITYEARDDAGNAAQATATVTVPHSMRR